MYIRLAGIINGRPDILKAFKLASGGSWFMFEKIGANELENKPQASE